MSDLASQTGKAAGRQVAALDSSGASVQGLPNELLVLETLGALTGPVRRGDVELATSLPARTVGAILGRLLKRGLIRRPAHGTYELTSAGHRVIAPGIGGASSDSFDAATEELLSPWHAAFARLFCDALVVRRLLPAYDFHPGFIAYGPHRTGKNLTVAFLIRSLGLGSSARVLQAGLLSPKSVTGRRNRGFFEPSPLLSLALVCFDEFADAEPPVRDEILKLFQGSVEISVAESSDELVRVNPVPSILFNPRSAAGGLPPSLVRPAIYRRSITLNTEPSRAWTRAADRAMTAYMRSDPTAIVDLGAIRLARRQLPEGSGLLLRSPLEGRRPPITDRGEVAWDLPKLELCALGRASRWALTEADDPGGAAAGVMIDALTCFETVPGWVDPEWRLRLEEKWDVYLASRPGGEQFREHLERARAAADAISARVEDGHRQKRALDLALVQKRAELASTLHAARLSIRSVPRTHGTTAAGLRKVLGSLEEKAKGARDHKSLSEVATDAATFLDDTGSLKRQIGAEARSRQEDDERRREERDREKEARRNAKRQRDGVLRQLRKWRAKCSQLLSRKRTQSPSEVVDQLTELGLLDGEWHRTAVSVSPKSNRPLDLIRWKVEGRRTEEVDVLRYRRRTDGRLFSAREVAEWTAQPVQELLEEAIAEIDRLIGLVESGALRSQQVALAALPAAGPLALGS